jgi:hypothetical protein
MAYFVQIVHNGTPGALYESPGSDLQAAQELLAKVLVKNNVEVTDEVQEYIDGDGYYEDGDYGYYIVSSELFSEDDAEESDEPQTTVDSPDGGSFEFDTDDGTIRYFDRHGNSEDVWRPGDEDYDAYKSQYFPKVEVVSEDEDEFSVYDGALYHEDHGEESLGEFTDGRFVPSKYLLELPAEFHKDADAFATQHIEDEEEEDRRDHKRGLYGEA